MGLGEERELVPLGPGFDITKRGYHTAQVNEHLERLEAELQLMHADRNAAVSQAGDLAKQLELSRSEIDELRKQIDRLSLPPTTLEGLSERLQRMLRLAQEESAEIQGRAEAEAGHIRAKAEADSAELRQRYERMLGELEKRRSDMEAEHRDVLTAARAEAEQLVTDARAEAERLDTASRLRREAVEEDFEIAMSGRRTEAMRTLAEQEATSKSEAERRVREATEEANRRRHDSIAEAKARLEEATSEAHRRVREATEESNRRISHAAQRVSALRQLRARVADQLSSARELIANAHVQLADAAPTLDPLPEERVPATVDGAPADNSPTRTMAPVKPASETAGPPRESWEPKDPDGGTTQRMARPPQAETKQVEKTPKPAPVKSKR
jgi:cell division septum initiation protein DivIVA